MENKGNSNSGKQTVINADGTIKSPELMQKAYHSKTAPKYS